MHFFIQQPLVAGLLLGVLLAIGDWTAIRLAEAFGRNVGATAWFLGVLGTLASVAYAMPWTVAAIGAATGTVFSGLTYWYVRRRPAFCPAEV